jgi:uncharacterized protein with GYD domain
MLGPYDFLDVFSADGMETALKVSSVTRGLGYSHTEIWPAVERQSYRKIIETLS